MRTFAKLYKGKTYYASLYVSCLRDVYKPTGLLQIDRITTVFKTFFTETCSSSNKLKFIPELRVIPANSC